MNIFEIKNILSHFPLKGEIVSARPHGDGHINDTFLIKCVDENNKSHKYTFQRINKNVFKEPDKVMENITNVTEFIKVKLAKCGKNADRCTLSVLRANDGKSYTIDKNGDYWRVYYFIGSARTYNLVESPEDFEKAGYAVGDFMMLLADYPAEELHETIKNFHNTPSRVNDLLTAIKEDKAGRVKDVQQEINFVLERQEFANTLIDANRKGEIPLRVTHNDTKLNNILFDKETQQPLCLIDLDTIMPGLSASDFGDAIRIGASTAAEDEKELSLVEIDLQLYEYFTKGYLSACGKSLTEKEIELLPVGAKMLTLECGMRFLTDYINGDTYFKIHYPDHNLVRCRAQFKLLSSMENNWNKMVDITKKYSK